MLTLDKIYHASYVLKEAVRATAVIPAPKVTDNCNLYLKSECLQVTGSFKVRGAYYKISQLSEEEKQKGGVAQGDIWWMQREITEKKKYLPASKQK